MVASSFDPRDEVILTGSSYICRFRVFSINTDASTLSSIISSTFLGWCCSLFISPLAACVLPCSIEGCQEREGGTNTTASAHSLPSIHTHHNHHHDHDRHVNKRYRLTPKAMVKTETQRMAKHFHRCFRCRTLSLSSSPSMMVCGKGNHSTTRTASMAGSAAASSIIVVVVGGVENDD